jgi:hypothetical protein
VTYERSSLGLCGYFVDISGNRLDNEDDGGWYTDAWRADRLSHSRADP